VRRRPRWSSLLAACSLIVSLAATSASYLTRGTCGSVYRITRNAMSYSVSHRTLEYRWEPGRAMLFYTHLESPLEPLGFRPTYTDWSVFRQPATVNTVGQWQFCTGSYRTGPTPYGQETAAYVGVCLWPLALLTALPPLLYLRRTRRPTEPPRCPHCHYDLRATPTRCPECGHVPAVSPDGTLTRA
jgi:hypothetical protein